MPKRHRERLYDEDLPFEAPRGFTPYTAHIEDQCSQIEKKFCQYMAAGYPKHKSAIMAGYKPTRAHHKAYLLLREPRIIKYRAELEAEALCKISVSIDEHVRKRHAIANLSIDEFCDYYTPPCRHCWGDNNEYQRTAHEMEEALLTYQTNSTKNKPPFNPRGGEGYHDRQPPNPDCPNCFGDGDKFNKRMVLKDWSDMSSIARSAITSVKMHSDGTLKEFITDKAAANAEIAAYIRSLLDPEITPDGDRLIGIRSKPPEQGGPLRIARVERIVIDVESVEVDN